MAYLLVGIRNLWITSYLEGNFKRFLLLLKVAFQKESVVVINGPGIENTSTLVSYLESNDAILSRKLITKLYVT
jgi:hypothetical protein